MNQPLYKKGNRFAWIGFLLGIVFVLLNYMSHPELSSGAINPQFMPSLAPFAFLFTIAHLICVGLIIWGAVLALKSKNRSMWWLLLAVPALSGAGIIFVAILFTLGDKSVVEAQPNIPKV